MDLGREQLTVTRDDDGGCVLRVCAAETEEQALAFHGDPARADGVLAICETSAWRAEPRAHLTYWLAAPEDRWYFDGGRLALSDYLEAWREDLDRVGTHPRAAVRDTLWPWLCERGYAGGAYDEALMKDFLSHAPPEVHLRPAVRLTYRWTGEPSRAEIRHEADRVLAALGEPPL